MWTPRSTRRVGVKVGVSTVPRASEYVSKFHQLSVFGLRTAPGDVASVAGVAEVEEVGGGEDRSS